MAAPAGTAPAPAVARRALGPRLLWTLAALLTLVGLAAAAQVSWRPAPAGLPDAGPLVVDGLPVLRLVTLLAGGIALGFALSAVALDPGAGRDRVGPLGRRDLRISAGAAGVLAAASVVVSVVTLADVLGIGMGEVLRPGIIATYLWDVESSRAHLVAGVLALAAAFGLRGTRSLGAGACWAAVIAVAVGLPALTGHAAGLGGHTLALVAGFGHMLATAVWGGGVVAIATHAVLRSPGMPERARRFGVVAILCVLVIALTGLAAALTRLDAPSQLVTTAYGRMVLAKVVGTVAALALAGTVRRAWQRPAGAPLVPVLAEVAVLGSVLGVAVVLARSPFPRQPVQLPTLGEDLIGYPYPPPPTVARVVLGWHPDWVWLTASLVAIALYAVGVILLRRRGDTWPVGRLVSWTLGWLVVVWATCAGVGWYAPTSFALHMISHMALAMLAPVLLVLGGPITLALRAIRPARGGARGPREWITWALHTPVTRFLTHPAYVLFIYTVGLYGLYYSGLYTTLMATHLGHLAMQVHFLAAGYLFYWVVIGVDAGPRSLPYSARLILLMASLVIHSFFAVPMMMAASPMVADWYAMVRPPWLADPIADTHVAGGIAWGFGEIPTLAVAIALAVQWSRSDDREARRADRRADLDGDADLRAYNERLARLDAASRGSRAPDRIPGDAPRRRPGDRPGGGPGRRPAGGREATGGPSGGGPSGSGPSGSGDGA